MKNKNTTFKLTIAILIGLILGIIVGFVMPGRFDGLATFFGLISSIYMNALRMMIYPLVFCSLIVGIKGIGSVSKTGKIGLQTIIYYCGTTLFASLLGLFLPKALGIGKGITIEMMESDIEATKYTSLLDTVKNLIPSNPVASFVNGDMLQVLVFAIIVGITIVALGEKADPLYKVCEAVNEVSVKIISVVMLFTPVGVFCSISSVIYANGVETIISLGKVMLAIYITYFLYMVVFYGIIVKFLGKCSLKKFWGAIMPAALNAFGTCSSSATLPISKKCADDLEIPNEISSLSLPLGATINMDAVSIVMSFMIVYFANACGIEVSFQMMVIVLLSNTLLSIGTPGVPGGAIASFAALSAVAGLPTGIMGVYISVNTLADMGATCCNVVGDLACSVAMKETVKLSDEKTA